VYKVINERERKLKNDKYDEAVEISQSFDQMAVSAAAAKKQGYNQHDEKGESKGMRKNNDQTKSQSVLNKPFDEALEFSQSGSEESVDTRASQKDNRKEPPPDFKSISSAKPNAAPQLDSSINKKQPNIVAQVFDTVLFGLLL
jgi:hypothetical protein